MSDPDSDESEPLRQGLDRFRSRHYPRLEGRFRRLAEEGQEPHTLFIGCSDSRVLPDLLADAGPGDLFVVRNVGGLVPPPGSDPSVGAAVEYAVGILEVSHAVVCGHSRCGAVRALFDPPEADAPELRRWLEHARPAAERARDAAGDAGAPDQGGDGRDPGVPDPELLREAERQSVRLQVERLREHPPVREALARDRVRVHGWHYRIGRGRVDALDAGSGEFAPALEEAPGPQGG